MRSLALVALPLLLGIGCSEAPTEDSPRAATTAVVAEVFAHQSTGSSEERLIARIQSRMTRTLLPGSFVLRRPQEDFRESLLGELRLALDKDQVVTAVGWRELSDLSEDQSPMSAALGDKPTLVEWSDLEDYGSLSDWWLIAVEPKRP